MVVNMKQEDLDKNDPNYKIVTKRVRINKPVGRISSLRAMLGMNQREFAEALNVNRVTLSCYEHGRYHPSIPVCMRIIQLAASKGYDINLEYLLNVPMNRKKKKIEK